MRNLIASLSWSSQSPENSVRVYIGRHPKQEYHMADNEPRVHEPPQVVGQVVGEVASLHVAIDGGEGKGKQHCIDGSRLAFGPQRVQEDPTVQ